MPTSLQCLLLTYESAPTMCEALDNFQTLRQSSNEKEEDYLKRLKKVMFRCGNVPCKDETMILYVD